MENKQTAIEWLINEYKIQGFLYDLDIEASKAMEKEQIKNAWENGYWEGCKEKLSDNTAEVYYIKTYLK